MDTSFHTEENDHLALPTTVNDFSFLQRVKRGYSRVAVEVVTSSRMIVVSSEFINLRALKKTNDGKWRTSSKELGT